MTAQRAWDTLQQFPSMNPVEIDEHSHGPGFSKTEVEHVRATSFPEMLVVRARRSGATLVTKSSTIGNNYLVPNLSFVLGTAQAFGKNIYEALL